MSRKIAIDIVLLPIGPCEPREYMKHSHMSSQEAIQAFEDLQARVCIPMHWGTFYFGTDSFLDPLTLLHKGWRNRVGTELQVFKVGQERVY